VKVLKHRPTGTQLNIENGQDFKTEGATLRAFHCPGHTVDHTAFVLSEESAMFTGDNVLGHGTAVFEDLATYLHSLEHMQAQFQGRAYPGHGAVVEDGNSKIKEYIAHRQKRDGEVLKALEDASPKPLSPMEIVTVVYQGYPENLFEAAAKGVLQILEKLRQEGKVKQSEDKTKWQIVGRAALQHEMVESRYR
jgi:ribonuclease/clavin/mitogillin